MSAALDLRPLTPEDASIYFAFRLSALREAPQAFGRSADEYVQEPLSTVASMLEERPGERVTLGAWQAGALVGSVTCVRETGLKRRHKGHVYAVYVAPAARGGGVASALLAAVLGWAQAVPGLTQLHLGVSVTQDAARRLYRRHGFTVYGLEPRALRVDGQLIDEELMWRRVDDSRQD